jgi:predicted acylesterase/phospholipase RssA
MLHFYEDHGLNPDLCFGDIQKVRLLTVAADLNSGRTVLFGLDPKESVLEGVLASSALPPWIRPMVKDEQYLMDGGTVSTLPVEPALSAGATEIIAFDLFDPRDGVGEAASFGPFLRKLLATVELRQIELELALAAAIEVPVKHIRLSANLPTPLWDFHNTQELIRCGYEQAREQIDEWQPKRKPRWLAWLGGRGK